jgi:hypothetical protein
VAEPTTFGRRRVQSLPAARPAVDVHALGPEAEAFRRELSTGRPAAPSDFSDWWRTQQAKRLFAWFLTLALLTPGVLCFVFQTPWPVSAGLELGGILINWWLRRERRRRLKEIASWESPAA